MPRVWLHLGCCFLAHVVRAEFAWTQKSQQCARMSETSNVWPDATTGFKWKFDLHVTFPLTEGGDFLDKKVRLEWRNPLHVDKVQPQGAVIAVAGGPNWVEVEATPQYVGHDSFSVEGYRESGEHEDLLSPTISCGGGSDVPPPAPPKAQPDCDLLPEVQSYPLGATRSAGSDVTIKLSKWMPFRLFSLTYYGQKGLLVSKPNGVTWVDNPHYVDDSSDLITFTFTLDPNPSDGERCEGHVACIEFEATPAPHHKPHIVCIQSPPPMPPEPPSTPPPLLAPPSSSPSPPPVASPANIGVKAAKSCHLGGSAMVLRQKRIGNSQTEVKIAVSLDTWIEGYVVTLGIEGDNLKLASAINAKVMESGPQTIAEFSFSVQLLAQPEDLLALVMVIQGDTFDSVLMMSCSQPRQQHSPPPPSPPPPIALLTSRADSSATSHVGDGTASSYGGSSDGSDDVDSYGAALLPSPAPHPRSTRERGRQGHGSSLPTVVFLSAVCVVAFYAYRAGKFDSLLRSSTVMRVDGSDDRDCIEGEIGSMHRC